MMTGIFWHEGVRYVVRCYDGSLGRVDRDEYDECITVHRFYLRPGIGWFDPETGRSHRDHVALAYELVTGKVYAPVARRVA